MNCGLSETHKILIIIVLDDHRFSNICVTIPYQTSSCGLYAFSLSPPSMASALGWGLSSFTIQSILMLLGAAMKHLSFTTSSDCALLIWEVKLLSLHRSMENQYSMLHPQYPVN